MEIKKGLEALGDLISIEEVEKILEKQDLSDGEIYYEEFIQLLTKS
jgi:Ca2+-binding EF-hand superfamily protein